MPNPFPGMDPYLEGPLWSSVHTGLIVEFARQLTPQLNSKYVAWPTTRIVLATIDPIELPRGRVRSPDVAVYRTGDSGQVSGTATAPAPLMSDAIMPTEFEQARLEIRNAETDGLVTAIELLSPTNKRGDGLEEFQRKRRELLAGPAHYVEIDLLRIGKRFPVATTLPSVPYFVFLSRANCRPRTEIWPIALDQPLPSIPIPLLDGDPDANLNLQAAWETNYQSLNYGRVANHSGLPTVPLSEEQQAWADERLRAAGLKEVQ